MPYSRMHVALMVAPPERPPAPACRLDNPTNLRAAIILRRRKNCESRSIYRAASATAVGRRAQETDESRHTHRGTGDGQLPGRSALQTVDAEEQGGIERFQEETRRSRDLHQRAEQP